TVRQPNWRQARNAAVAAGVPPAGEGARPAARKEPTKLFDNVQIFETPGSDGRFVPPGWKPGSTAGEDARRHRQKEKIHFRRRAVPPRHRGEGVLKVVYCC
ncbi:MAG: hypothetical protein ABSE90_13865, partial [Verrucomicrobiota bacterium]